MFPTAMMSRRQTCVSHSTPEAELVAMDTTLRVVAMPNRVIWDVLSPSMKGVMFGDNEAMLQVIRTGRNPDDEILVAHAQGLYLVAQ